MTNPRLVGNPDPSPMRTALSRTDGRAGCAQHVIQREWTDCLHTETSDRLFSKNANGCAVYWESCCAQEIVDESSRIMANCWRGFVAEVLKLKIEKCKLQISKRQRVQLKMRVYIGMFWVHQPLGCCPQKLQAEAWTLNIRCPSLSFNYTDRQRNSSRLVRRIGHESRSAASNLQFAFFNFQFSMLAGISEVLLSPIP